jgi:hypothetical protein
MIVSHRHRFIFLKTRKTAGTSIEIALSKHCGPDDIITEVTPEDEQLRREWGGRGPQNHEATGDHGRAYNHMSADEVIRLVGQEAWNDYFTFTVERNPWDAAVSAYFWRLRDQEPIPFSDFVRSRLIERYARNPGIYRLDGVVAVDKVCRYEHLAEDLEVVRHRVGLPEPLELPRAKGTFRRDPRPYQEFYAPADIERVRELFADTVATCGYQF